LPSQPHDDSLALQSKQFLRLLSQYKRWSVLPSIYKLFQIIVAEHENRQQVGVFSSIDLSALQKETLTGELQAYYGGQLELQYHTSEKMAGGVCVRSGDFVIDFSIEDQMQKMAHCMGVKASVNDNEKRTST
jgi:F-type H+-transporting ATPase subunit delta